LPASTLNSIFAKKNEIREQIQKCGNACKKRKTSKYSTFAELETVLFTWYQKYDFHSYVSVDCDVATSGVSTVEELCKACGSTRCGEEKNKEGKNEQGMVPSFAETRL
jgi:hypothetical protein